MVLHFFVMLMCGACFVDASDKQSFISDHHKKNAESIITHSKKQMESYKADVLHSIKTSQSHGKTSEEMKKIIQSQSPCFSHNHPQKKGCFTSLKKKMHVVNTPNFMKDEIQIIVFVSFSMPKESIKTLFKDAEMYKNVRFVLRGFVNDSMEETVKKVQDDEGVLDIDPDIFEKYQIEQVPTFLWVKGDQNLGKISGNITLTYAQQIFKEKIEKGTERE